MAKRENDLGRDPVGKLLLRLAVPTVTAQLVNALYNIVDRMYICLLYTSDAADD